MVYKSLHGLTPEYLISKFVYRDLPYSIKDSTNKLHLPLPRTNYLKKIAYNSIYIYWSRTLERTSLKLKASRITS